MATKHQQRFAAAARQAKREGKKGKAFARRVGELLRGSGSKIKKRSGSGSPARSSGSNPGNHGPSKLGSDWAGAYRGGSTGVVAGSLGIDYLATGGRDPGELARWYEDATIRDVRQLPTAMAVRLADEVVGQKLVGHNAALARGSVTAWAAEGYAMAEGVAGGPRLGAQYYTDAKTGWLPRQHRTHLSPRLRRYLTLKYGLGAARTVVNRVGIVNRAVRPFKKALGSLGLSL